MFKKIMQFFKDWANTPTHYCSKCGGILMCGTSHICEGFSEKRIREMMREEIQRAKP